MRYAIVGQMSASRTAPAQRRSGFVLVAVLLVVVVLALSAYRFTQSMAAEYRVADGLERTAQARAFARSAIDYSMVMLSNPQNFSSVLMNNPFDNSAVFQHIIVQANDKPHFQGAFDIVAPLGVDATAGGQVGNTLGVFDEHSKININALFALDSSGTTLTNFLMALPNMTEDVANSIVDWIDPDDTTRDNGAESDYYSGLSPPYVAKNGPLDSIEELLMVKGVTPQLLFGNDQNRNGVLDPGEDDGTGVLDQGWSAYLTVFSRERNVSSQNVPRINVNSSDLTTLLTQLAAVVGEPMACYIVGARLYSPTPIAAGATKPATGGQLTQQQLGNLASPTTQPSSISSLFTLVNTTISIPGSNGQAATTYACPLNDASTLQSTLPLMLDQLTTQGTSDIPARLNVNTAPLALLEALPGITAAQAQTIFDQRPVYTGGAAPDPSFATTAWLLNQGNLTPTIMQGLDRYVTASSQVYRIQSIGYFDGGGPMARMEAVIDTNAGQPRLMYLRDLTELGKGFTPNTNQP
ncbi:MAG TPA: type II secretion system protein GspK [Gemmataceae bacterium]|jgi:type II secretory pathway component PulK|nr:type II secretion system protein GspK [Gemmataceae bacterium]